MTQNNSHIQDILEWVNANGFTINLTPERISFLLAIHTHQISQEQELTEEVLVDLYRQVLAFQKEEELTEATSASRANKIINDLVSQKLLNRFSLDFNEDEPSTDQSSIYRLSPLAVGIADNYVRQKEFSQVGLSMQLAMVAKEMRDITNALEHATDYESWRIQIYAPLRYSVAEIFDLIDYRQRVLDEEQHQIKQRIAELLSKDWTAAIDNCKELLASTGYTLRELQDTLSSAGDKLMAQLIAIEKIELEEMSALRNLEDLSKLEDQETARKPFAANELAAIDRYAANFLQEERVQMLEFFELLNDLLQKLKNKLDRIVAWGQKSIDLWLGFDRHIHKFIRNTIDLDKNRVFSTRLRRSLTEYMDNPWFLTYADQLRILDLRSEAQDLVEDNEVGEVPDEIVYETQENIQEQVASALQSILTPFATKGESLDIAMILRSILRDNPLAQHFDLARIFIEQAMRLGMSEDELSGVQAIWQDVNDNHAQVQANIISTYPSSKAL